jgi:capsid portal protein
MARQRKNINKTVPLSNEDRIRQEVAASYIKSKSRNFVKGVSTQVKDSLVDSVKQDILKYSRQDPDPTELTRGSTSAFSIVEPEFHPRKLVVLVNTNDVLKQTIKCIQVNAVGNGYSLNYIGKAEEQENDDVKLKKEFFQDLLDNPNPDKYGHEFFDALVTDFAMLNRAYIEVVRGNVVDEIEAKAKSKVLALYHVPAVTMRKTAKDEKPVVVKSKLKRYGKVRELPVDRYFRRFAQVTAGNPKTYTYFKEFEDPRDIDAATGQVVTDLPKFLARGGKLATEIYEITDYEPDSLYAHPVWINQLTAILGSKLCNEVNLSFFQNNMIPAMVVLTAGGGLTENSYNQITQAFENLRGGKSFNNILFLEAVGDEDAASDDGAIPVPKLDIKPLGDVRQDDAIFQKYKDAANRTIMSSFRIDPILIGLSEARDRAAAEVAILAAEAEVFAPLRKKLEDFMSRVILVDDDGFTDKHWTLKFRPTNVMKQDSIFTAIRYGIASGAFTPNMIINILNNTLNTDIPNITSFWGSIPATSVRDSFKSYLESLANEGKIITNEDFEKFLEQGIIPTSDNSIPQETETMDAQVRQQS